MSDDVYRKVFSQFEGIEGELIPLLQKTQEMFGYISEEGVTHISRFIKISENQIFGVASFYSQFRFTEPGRNSIKVCMGTACHVQGGQVLCEAVERELGIIAGQTTPDKRYDFQRVACLGCCALAPVVQINDDIYSQVSVIKLQEILNRYE
ncbi:NAD(P)H-dependent oxidoreductase subunit E [bacterium]|nr:NAD(P)H-dependent oxidoreductase subunit E [bacterium]